MNNDIIGKEVVFYENNTWNHIIKEINLYTYTIEYEIKREEPGEETTTLCGIDMHGFGDSL